LGGNKKRKTVVVIVASLVRYAGYIVVIVLLFNIWELDPAILAGVVAALGVALAFGAQGLISDLLTGIFLIFESSLQVGDWVTFDGFRGEVEEISIRTTKFRAVNGSVMVLNNSQLKKFINMTMHRSVAACDLVIGYNEDIEKVEKIIFAHFPIIADKYPVITEGPFYKGVDSLTDKGMKLKIVAKCREHERPQLERDLNREFKTLFDEHNIKLAIPRMRIVEEPAEVERKETTTKKK